MCPYTEARPGHHAPSEESLSVRVSQGRDTSLFRLLKALEWWDDRELPGALAHSYLIHAIRDVDWARVPCAQGDYHCTGVETYTVCFIPRSRQSALPALVLSCVS